MTTDNTQGLVEILNNLGERHIMAEHGLVGSKDAETERAVKRILDWHNKQVEEAMAKFHLRKGVKYDVKASNSVIVITHTNKLKERDDDQL